MAFFKKLFKKSDGSKTPKGFHSIQVAAVSKIGGETVKVEFSIPAELKNDFNFVPGQYINFNVDVNGKNYRRIFRITK